MSQPGRAPTIMKPKSENLATNIPLAKVLDVSRFFNDPANKVKIQFPIEESRFAWVNMSKFYPTGQFLRSGQVSELGYWVPTALPVLTA